MGVELSTPQTTGKKMIKKVLPTRGNPLSLLHADLNQIVVSFAASCVTELSTG